MTLKQQLKGEKWDKKLKNVSVFGWAMFSCPVLGRFLVSFLQGMERAQHGCFLTLSGAEFLFKGSVLKVFDSALHRLTQTGFCPILLRFSGGASVGIRTTSRWWQCGGQAGEEEGSQCFRLFEKEEGQGAPQRVQERQRKSYACVIWAGSVFVIRFVKPDVMLKCHLCFLYHFVFMSDWEKDQCMEYLYCYNYYYYYRLYTECRNHCYLVICLMAKNLWNENKLLNWKFWFAVVGLFFSYFWGWWREAYWNFRPLKITTLVSMVQVGGGGGCWWGVFVFWGLIFKIYFKIASEIWCTLKEKLKCDSYDDQIM